MWEELRFHSEWSNRVGRVKVSSRVAQPCGKCSVMHKQTNRQMEMMKYVYMV